MNKIVKVLLSLLLVFSLVACKEKTTNDVIIIYTSDVHGYCNESLGYASVYSFKQEALKKTPYVALVDAGDAYVGTAYAQLSEGQAVVECINTVGYDYLGMGNHEFDYGITRFGEIVNDVSAKYLNSNIVYTGQSGAGNYLNEMSKYDIVQYGDLKVGFLAVDTPTTIMNTNPVKIKEDGYFCVDFYFDDITDNFFSNIQNIIDEMKTKGADVVVCISHLGFGEEYDLYSSTNLANNTSGIDVIIDGHAHINIPSAFEKNINGEQVIITSCGTGIDNIGYITISSNKTINTTTTSNYEFVSDENKALFDGIVDKYASELEKELFTSEYALSIKDESGIRMVRNREVAIGDLFADALRYYGEADIGIMNGGGIRANIPQGSVSYSNLIEIAPYENKLAVIEISGQELVDYLEYSYRNVASEYAKNGESYGEEGSFMQLSGLKLTIDTSIKPDINVDENDYFISVNNNRRVKDVYVLENGEYVPIDLNKTYTLASTDYSIVNGGSGTAVIFADNRVILNSEALYSQVLIDYIIDVLKCDLSAYKQVDNRITIE